MGEHQIQDRIGDVDDCDRNERVLWIGGDTHYQDTAGTVGGQRSVGTDTTGHVRAADEREIVRIGDVHGGEAPEESIFVG